MKATTFMLTLLVSGIVIFLTVSLIAMWLWEYDTYRATIQDNHVAGAATVFAVLGAFFITFMIEMDIAITEREEEEKAKKAYWQRYYRDIYR